MPYYNCASHDKCFLRRVKDKKFYRGAKFWRFTNTWRNAAVLPIWSWQNKFEMRFLNDYADEFEFVFLNDVE